MTPAASLTNQIRLAASKIGARLFPMVVGKFWGPYHRGNRFTKTQTITVHPGDVLIRQGHMVSVGQAGMSDLVGFIPHVVTEADLGQTFARYLAVEVKAGDDRLRPGQPEFIEAVQKNGGLAGVARSPREAVRIIKGG